MADLIKKFHHYEPLMTNRWLVRTQESFQNVPEYVVKDFKITTVDIENGKKKNTKALKLTLHFHNMVQSLLVPDDVMYCKKVIIDFLDPTGVVVNNYIMNVEFDTFTLVGDYGDSNILTHEVTFWIKSMESLSSKSVDEETLKNYQKNKKKES